MHRIAKIWRQARLVASQRRGSNKIPNWKFLSSTSSGSGGGFVQWYTHMLESKPIVTKVVSSGLITGGGDATCQLMSKKKDEKFDLGRLTRFTFLGAFLVAPTLHFWYGYLHRAIEGTSMTAVLKRLAMDQLVFAPLFIPTFMTSLSILEGNAAQIVDRLRTSWGDALVSNWGLWVPANLVNFRFVPNVYQVLFANSVGFVWNIILSFQASKEIAK